MLIATGMQGNLRTKTARAFTEDEFRKIVAGLPRMESYSDSCRLTYAGEGIEGVRRV